MTSENRSRESSADHDREALLARTLAKCQDRFAAGDALDMPALLETHPDVADELASELRFLEDLELIFEDQQLAVDFGDFKILCEAGRGGMGIVYEAWQISLQRKVALKILSPSLLADEKALRRFQQEARAAARLDHRNIVGVYATGLERDSPYIVMEFAEGEPLNQTIDRLRPRGKDGHRFHFEETTLDDLISAMESSKGGELSGSEDNLQASEPVVVEGVADPSRSPGRGSGSRNIGAATSPAYFVDVAMAFAGAADGLQHAHGRSVVHRDLKPSNLILDSHGCLRILDFGVARVEGQKRLTVTTDRVGTPLYMSPEQVRGHPGGARPTTDIYSLGATLYEALAWRPPFEGKTPQETLQQITHRDPPGLRQVQVPRDLETIVLKCLRKDPRERYGTAEALAQDLRRFARGDPIEARPHPWYEQLARRAWRSKRKILEVTGALVLVFTLGALLYHGVEERSARHEELQRQQENAYHTRVHENAVKVLLSDQLPSPFASVNAKLARGEKLRMAGQAQGFFQRRTGGGSDSLFEVGPEVEGPVVVDAVRGLLEEATSALEGATDDFPEKAIGYYHLARGLFRQGRADAALDRLQRALAHEPDFLPVLGLKALILEQQRSFPATDRAFAEFDRVASHSDATWPDPWLEANRSILRQDWESAAGDLNALLAIAGDEELYPGFSEEMQLRRGIAYLESGSLPGALVDFGVSEYNWSDRLEPTLVLGKIFYLSGDPNSAAERFEGLLRRARKAGTEAADDVAKAVASTYREVGNVEAALEWARKMTRSSTRLLLEAEFLCHLKADAEAQAAAELAVELGENDGHVSLTLGNVWLGLGKLEGAREWYSLARKTAPFDAKPLVGLGVCLELQEKLDEAEKLFRSAIHLDASLEQAHYNLGRVLSRRGEVEEALASHATAIRLDPGHARAYNNRGILLDQQGELHQAMENFRRATELAPTLAQARFNLGWAFHRQRRYGEAAIEYLAAIELDLDDADVFGNLGSCLHYQRKWYEAIEVFQEALEKAPGDGRIYYSLGVALQNTHQLKEAAAAYRKATRLEPKLVNAHMELGGVLASLGQHEKAIARFRYVAENQPGFAFPHNNLANLLIARNAPVPRGAELRKAIVQLEEAAFLPKVDPAVNVLLRRYRDALLPDLASYASVDSFVENFALLVSKHATWRFYQHATLPSPGLEWTAVTFDDTDDSAWKSRTNVDDFPRANAVPTILDDVEGTFGSLYLRHRFHVSDPSWIRKLSLWVRADDGFVVYLNGSRVGRIRPRQERGRFTDQVGQSWRAWEFDVDPRALHAGTNVLALQAIDQPREFPEFLYEVLRHPGFSFTLTLRAETQTTAEKMAVLEQGFEAFQADASPNLVSYFQGRLAELRGDRDAALGKFRDVLEQDRGRPEPLLRIAECFRGLGAPERAEQELRSRLSSAPVPAAHETLWDGWLRLAMVDLDRSPTAILDTFPAPRGELEALDGHAADALWLLERLERQEVIRINCGGTDSVTVDGKSWSGDRFCRGGAAVYFSLLDDRRDKLMDPGLYQTGRDYGGAGQVTRGYSIPLPKGRYHVTLHFIEAYKETARSRFFDVWLEGKSCLTNYEPLREHFGVPDQQECEIAVSDGTLDIDFGQRLRSAIVCGIEIERL